MAFDPQPLIYATTSTTGTGAFTCTGAVSGYRPFSSIANGDAVPIIRWDATGAYEEGEATVSTSGGVSTISWVTRTRTSNVGNAAVNWSGTQNVKVDGLGSMILHWRNYGLEFAGNLALFRTNTSTERAFASGTKWAFVQSAAPTGWTQVTSVNDKFLRIVSGSGGGTGGSNTIAGLTASAVAVTTGQLATHTHGLYKKTLTNNLDTMQSGPSVTFVIDVADGTDGTYTHFFTEPQGSGSTHTHTISHDGTKAVAYQDCIVCAKD